MYSVKIIHKYYKQTDIKLTAEGSGGGGHNTPLWGIMEGTLRKVSVE
jgi:hypothetical protein